MYDIKHDTSGILNSNKRGVENGEGNQHEAERLG